MVRNVVMVWLKEGVDEAAIERMFNAMLSLQVPGLLNVSCGRDAGLRQGNASAALVVDLEDEDAYRAYDGDPEHNRIRRELVAPIAERVERLQYRI